jgi:hypothetical protein
MIEASVCDRIALRRFAPLLHNHQCHGLWVGWWGAVRDRSGGLRDWDGIPVQSTAKLACAASGLGSFAGLASFPGMACPSPGLAAGD